MEAGNPTANIAPEPARHGAPAWVLGLVPLLLIIAAVGLFSALGGPGLGARTGPPVEELSVERTKLVPGAIELTVRNDGPDAVSIAQVVVNDAYAGFRGAEHPIGRLSSEKLVIEHPWNDGEAYTVSLLTPSGCSGCRGSGASRRAGCASSWR